MIRELGRLERLSPREYWLGEARDFTPWLAAEENIRLLGDAIGLELEVEGQEKSVGLFRADILCKDTVTGHYVLVENQLERTDHSHLGQLLTYAAGLQAVTIVWIAERFTDEHRAALDWLNQITDERFSFFGLEIELWRIGSSPLAPKFNVVSKPNDWSKTVSTAANNSRSGDLGPARQLQLEYWAGLKAVLDQHNSRVKSGKLQPQNWADFAIGRSEFLLQALVHTREKWIGAGLMLSGLSAKAHYHLLHVDKMAIEQDLGFALEWDELPGRKGSFIGLYKDADPSDRQAWAVQHTWLAEKLEALHKVFGPRIKVLNAANYQPPIDSSLDNGAPLP